MNDYYRKEASSKAIELERLLEVGELRVSPGDHVNFLTRIAMSVGFKALYMTWAA